MSLYPLCLMPQVIVSQGQAQMPLSPGSDAEYGSVHDVVAAFAEQGAAWVHVADKDAASGQGNNYADIARATGAHIQLSAHIKDQHDLEAALQAKPTRIVIEAEDLTWTQNVLAAHGDLLAVGLDIRKPGVFDVRVTLDQAGASRYVVRDMATHHLWHHEDRHLLAEFCEQTSKPVIAAGGIAHLDDLHELHELVPEGLDGIILGAPLYNGAFTYPEAVAAGADRFDMFFWGPPQP
jgi:phosphoribosylformimino-5-aminoimidazole carboxamide ribotide isomerase/phosphoribosylanthranilate isomerase